MKKNASRSLTQEQISELNFAQQQLTIPQLSKRIQCIKLKNEWWTHQKVSTFLWISKETIRVRIATYKTQWINKLLGRNYIWRKKLLSQQQIDSIQKRHKSDPFVTARQCQHYIQENFGIEYHLHRVQKLIKNNFKTPTKK